jgi:phage gp29-like protein
VEAVGVPAGNSGQAFDTFEAAVVRRIQKVILGQTLTSGTDNGSGNRALGQVHDAVRMDKRNSDILMVLPTLQKIVDAVCELNGWKKMEAVFADEVGLEAQRATRDKDLYSVGVRFEKGYFQDNYDLREEDFTLSSEAPVTGATPAEPGSGGDGNPGQTGDAKATPNSGNGAQAAKLLPHLFTKHGADSKFTKQQTIVEDQADAALQEAAKPLDPEKVRAAVLAATSPEDLADRLFALVGSEVSTQQFRTTLERALYAADVLGYVHAEGKV